MNQSLTFRYILWIAATLFYAFQYIIRVFPSLVYDDIAVAFSVRADDYSLFTGIYYVGYALLHLPIAYALDRVGPKVVLPLFMILAALGNMPLVYSTSWDAVVWGRFLIGIGSSAAILGVFKAVRLAFKQEHFALMLGISVTVGLMGAIYGGKPVAYLLADHSKAFVVNSFLVAGLILAALTFLVAPNTKEKASIKLESLWSDTKAIFTNSRVVFTALFGALMVGPLEGFADVWGPKFLSTLYSFSVADGAELTSYVFFGMAVGAILLPYVAEKTKAYYEVTTLSGLVMAAGFWMVMYISMTFSVLATVFFVIGIMCAYQVLLMHMNGQNVRAEVSVMAASLTNMIVMIFGFVFHTAIGRMMTVAWDGQVDTATNAPIYSLEAFKYGLLVIPAGLVIGFVGIWLVRPKHKVAVTA